MREDLETREDVERNRMWLGFGSWIVCEYAYMVCTWRKCLREQRMSVREPMATDITIVSFLSLVRITCCNHA
jgi:hypothetical protein